MRLWKVEILPYPSFDMLVDPLQTPTSWMILQADQHRRPPPMTPGIAGEQPRNDWLSLLVEGVRLLVRVCFRILVGVAVPPLSVVNWIRRYASVHRDKSIFKTRHLTFASTGMGLFVARRC